MPNVSFFSKWGKYANCILVVFVLQGYIFSNKAITFWENLSFLIAGSIFVMLLMVFIERCHFLNLKNICNKRRVKYSEWLFGGLIAIVLVFGGMLMPKQSSFGPLTEIEIVATGEKNPQAHSAEVWVKKDVQNLTVKNDGNWEEKNGRYVAYKTFPATLKYVGRISDKVELNFIQHPFSGIVDVKINGKRETVDLYKKDDSAEFSLYVNPTVFELDNLYCQIFSVTLVILIMQLIAFGISFLPRQYSYRVLLSFLLAILFFLHSIEEKNVGDVEMIGFTNDKIESSIYYSTGYGFNDAQKKIVTEVRDNNFLFKDKLQNPLEVTFIIKKNESVNIRVRGDSIEKIQDDGIVKILVPAGAGPVMLDIHDGEFVEAVVVTDGKKEEKLSIPSLHKDEIFLIERTREGTRFLWKSFSLNFSKWEMDTRRLEGIKFVSTQTNKSEKVLKLVQVADSGKYLFLQGKDGEYFFNQELLGRALPKVWLIPKLIASLFAGIIIFGVLSLFSYKGSIVKKIKLVLIKERACIAVSGTLAVYFFVHLLIWWPGVCIYDSFSPIIQYTAGAYNTWYGLGAPMLTSIILQFGEPSLETVVLCVMHLLFFLLVISYAYYKRVSAILIGGVITYIIVGSFVGYMSVYHYRDSFSGIVNNLLLVVSGYFILTNKSIDSRKNRIVLVGMFLMMIISYALRTDNLVIIVGTWTSIGIFRVFSRKKYFVLSTMLLLVFFAFSQLVNLIASSHSEEKNRYLVAATVNQVGSIVSHENYVTNNKERDEEIINKVIDKKILVEEWSPNHIVYWHNYGNMQVNRNEAIEFSKLCVKLIKDNPLFFLSARAQTFHNSMNFNSAGDIQIHNLRFKEFRDIGLWRENDFLAKSYGKPIFEVMGQYVSTWWQLLIVVGAVFIRKRNPIVASLALTIFLKSLAIMLLAPAAVSSYYYDLHIFGIIAPLLMATERKYKASFFTFKK